MARQRFIHPEFWTDPTIGKLRPVERLFFIGCFSNADDEGRLLGNPAYLRSTIFPYDDMSLDEVKAIRDAVIAQCRNLVLYEVDGVEYLAFTKWHVYQKPKYPQPSKLPPPPNCPTKPVSKWYVPKALREKVLEKHGFRCARCGATEDLVIVHIVPLRDGGTSDEDNLQVLCARCKNREGSEIAAGGNSTELGQGSSNLEKDSPNLEKGSSNLEPGLGLGLGLGTGIGSSSAAGTTCTEPPTPTEPDVAAAEGPKPEDRSGDEGPTPESRALDAYFDTFGRWPSGIIQQDLLEWLDRLGPDLLVEAMRRTAAANTRSWRYTEAILRVWADANVKTLDDVARLDAEHERTKEAQNHARARAQPVSRYVEGNYDWDKLAEG